MVGPGGAVLGVVTGLAQPVPAVDLDAVRRRHDLACMAGRDADEAGNGWDEPKLRALIHSWQDVAALHDELTRQRAASPGRGSIERQVRADVAKLGELDGARTTYAEVAYRLARALDVDDTEGATGLAGAARELRAALDEVWKGVKHGRPSDSVVSGLGTAVGGVVAAVPAPVRDDPQLRSADVGPAAD